MFDGSALDLFIAGREKLRIVPVWHRQPGQCDGMRAVVQSGNAGIAEGERPCHFWERM